MTKRNKCYIITRKDSLETKLMAYKYNNHFSLGGISKDNREKLDIINREFPGPFEVSDIENLFRMGRSKVARLLAHWASKGWLTRIRRGLYITVPLGADNPQSRSEDPWVVANKVFEPCYVGGWSACEHWGLTDQIFDSLIIFTGSQIRQSKLIIQNVTYILRPATEKKSFGIKIVWKGRTKIRVSGPTRTVVDILNDPFIGGGMRHVVDVLRQYFAGEFRDDKLLAEYIEKAQNKTIYKRLGFILESLKLESPELIKKCAANLSQGFSLFDPSGPDRGRYLRRWHLRINVNIAGDIMDDQS